MARGLLLAFVVALGSPLLPDGAAALPPQSDAPKLERAGWGFACVLNQAQFKRDPKSGLSPDAACGQVGPLALGMGRSAAEKVLGAPTSMKAFGSSISYVYSLQTDETQTVQAAKMITSVTMGYDSANRVRSIQLTGRPWPAAWSFADIKLGDSGKDVIARLGEPHEVSLGKETSTFVWDYLPWTFSFEIRNAHVSSIRVSE